MNSVPLTAAGRRRAARRHAPTIHRAGRVPPTSPPVPSCPRYVTCDYQETLLPHFREARARRELYANCERAPLGWEKYID